MQLRYLACTLLDVPYLNTMEGTYPWMLKSTFALNRLSLYSIRREEVISKVYSVPTH